MQHLQSGAQLQNGKYRIISVLGQGGFGITYLAEQPLMLNRKVAIKEFYLKDLCNRDETTHNVTIPTLSNKEIVEECERKFVKEAQMIYGFKHSNLCEVFDIFKENKTTYYVMEYVEGSSLSTILKEKGKLSEDIALQYIRKVAAALEYIHEKKYNHLDVKPANILVRKSDNEIKLIDFGTSKHYDSATGNATTRSNAGYSPGYAPMEQYKKGGVNEFTPESDIYSLGATLYKLVTGITPPEPSEIVNEGFPTLPDSLSNGTREAITRSMSIAKNDRPRSIKDFLSLLDMLEKPEKKHDKDDSTVRFNGKEKKKSGQKSITKKNSGLKITTIKKRIKKAIIPITVIIAAIVAFSVYAFYFSNKVSEESELEYYANYTELNSELDSVAYFIGYAHTLGLNKYLNDSLSVDTTHLDEFYYGLIQGCNVSEVSSHEITDDIKENSYRAGQKIGQNIINDMIPGVKEELFGKENTNSIPEKSYLAGFIQGNMGIKRICDMDKASSAAQDIISRIKENENGSQYASYKKENEEWLAANKNKEGVSTTPSGLQYKIIKKGNGSIPNKESIVKVHYEGKLIDGTVFDSSYSRGEPIEFQTNQVIKGWTEALTMMPAGSVWELYIPQELAYGSTEQAQIKPFSTLIFKVELISIE